ncbi:hypothetical protein STENM327S_02521 [Streptomyces tendae]
MNCSHIGRSSPNSSLYTASCSAETGRPPVMNFTGSPGISRNRKKLVTRTANRETTAPAKLPRHVPRIPAAGAPRVASDGRFPIAETLAGSVALLTVVGRRPSADGEGPW